MAKITDEAGNAITDENGHGIYDEAGIAESLSGTMITAGSLTTKYSARRSLSGSETFSSSESRLYRGIRQFGGSL